VRLTRLVLWAAALGVFLTGCGSSGNGLKGSISSMQSAISKYNTATPGDVASTGQACQGAAGKLATVTIPAPTAVPTAQRALDRTLQSALRTARHGFNDCAAAGSANNYVRMAQSTDEINAANRLLAKARSQDG
jgi:hypothetical protein